MVTADPLFEHLRETLGDAYGLERELGGGGMSRVFLATENRLNRRVVIKVLPPESASLFTSGRFWRETEICARIQHPHVVPLLASGEIEGVPWFTMPYIEGESLRERLAREGALPVAEAVRLLAEVADALDCAHRYGVVHRDIKPDNILLSHGHALVADFGVAKAFDAVAREGGPAVTTTGIALGTPAYMAPEQALGDPLTDHRADLYALGVIAWEMLGGRPPFQAASAAGLASAHLTQAAEPLTVVRPDCPPALSDLVARLLAKQPQDRPATAAEVREALRNLPAGGAGTSGRSRAVRRILAGAGILGAAAVAFLLFRAPARTAPPAPGVGKSVAVLPFEYLGRDSAGTFIGAGLADELISALGRLPGLRVASRTSTFALRGQALEVADIGKRLGVAVVLEGEVRQAGDRLRVSASLVQTSDGLIVWSDTFEEQAQDVFAVQERLAQAIARRLSVQLAAGGAAIVRRGTADPVAHELYLRGRYFAGLRTPEALQRAAAVFDSATRRDSSYALAYAGLADAWSLLGGFGGVPPHEAFPRARAAADRAIALDPTQAEVLTSIGMIEFFYDWRWDSAGAHLRRAVELNPSYAQGHLFYSWYLLEAKLPDSALAEIRRARSLDPYSLIINVRIGNMLHYFGRNGEAEQAVRQTLALDSTHRQSKSMLALILSAQGRLAEALQVAPTPDGLYGTYEAGTRPFVLGKSGRREESRREAMALEALAKRSYIAADALALAWMGVDDHAAALRLLERAVDERAFTLVFADVFPEFAPLRNEPRFQAIIRRVRGR